jgi:hypothetical protein
MVDDAILSELEALLEWDDSANMRVGDGVRGGKQREDRDGGSERQMHGSGGCNWVHARQIDKSESEALMRDAEWDGR